MGCKPNWTEEEIEYVEEKWGVYSIKSIAEKLGRSINAVKLKAQRMGLGDARLSIDGITVNQLSIAANIPYRTIKYWIEHKEFPVKKKLLAVENRILIIRYQDFWKWAEKNKRRVDFSKIEPNILGPEPEWAKKKRNADLLNNCNKPHNEPWSKEEDKELVSMVHAFRFTYPEISKRLKRTETAVKRRLWELSIKAKPIRLNNHIKWTEEEVKLLVDLFEKGYSLSTIAERIGKSALGVRGKLERMGYRFRKTGT